MGQTKKHVTLSFLFIVFFLSHVNGKSQDKSSKHFVLVHGACHGAWSWYKIMAPLTSSGHKVTALDLAASGVNPLQISDLRSVSDYHRPLLNFMAALPPQEKVILVGHSFGGWALAQAMELFPNKISVAVFLTAYMPGPNLNASSLNPEILNSLGDLMDTTYTYGNRPNEPPTGYLLGPLLLKARLYQLSPIQDWKLATTLGRTLRLLSPEDVTKELIFTVEKYGSVKRVCIVPERDEIVKRELQQLMIDRNPPNEVIEIKGSDHMAMMSRPKQLVTHLLTLAKKYN